MVTLSLGQRFWYWYERHYTLNVGFASGLFLLQLIHLYWLTTHVVAQRLFGQDLFPASVGWHVVVAVIDYTEIPALIATSFLYLYHLRQRATLRHRLNDTLFLLLLNLQWLHLFWITDEIVIDHLAGRATGLTFVPWLAGLAIVIDYLEVPVIFDTIRKFLRVVRERL